MVLKVLIEEKRIKIGYGGQLEVDAVHSVVIIEVDLNQQSSPLK